MHLVTWSQFLEEALLFGGKRSAMTVGVFDGVHRGHQPLIERIVAHNATTAAAIPVVVTFRQSHYKKNLISGKDYPGNILSFRQKLDIFESLGVSITIVIDFSESFRRMSGIDFFQALFDHGKMSFLAVGSEFRCGYHLDTDVPAIQKFCCCRDIPTAIVPPLTHGDEPISSSHIRSAITCGELKAAAAMLGRPFTVDLAEASVVSADGISYDIAGQGCLLPPPGRYPVTLFDKNFDRGSARQTDIRIENGSIIISGHLSDTRWEYVEF